MSKYKAELILRLLGFNLLIYIQTISKKNNF